MTALLCAAAVFTNVADVRALAVDGATVWAATAGGVVEVDAASRAVRHVYTALDGLDATDVREVFLRDGLHARTAEGSCVLRDGQFRCVPALPSAAAPRAWPRYRGFRETARVEALGATFVATAGGGLWADGAEITGTSAQPCGNHVEALGEFRGEVWVGSFDGGLCAFDGKRFRGIRAPVRMVNDLLATRRGLAVAAAEGLFFTTDGVRFRRDARIRERGVNRLATDGRWLYATTPAALYAIRLDGRDIVRRFRNPGGSTAVQAVTVSGRDVWLATEDRGAVRLRGDRFTLFDRAAGLPSSWAIDVAAAPEGGVYVTTLRNGTARIARNGTITRVRGLDAWGLRLVRDGDGVLAGTQGGAARIVGVAAAPFALPGELRVHALMRRGRSLFLGTETGLWQLDEWSSN